MSQKQYHHTSHLAVATCLPHLPLATCQSNPSLRLSVSSIDCEHDQIKF